MSFPIKIIYKNPGIKSSTKFLTYVRVIKRFDRFAQNFTFDFLYFIIFF